MIIKEIHFAIIVCRPAAKMACDAETISEQELQNAVVRVINKTLGGKDIMLEILKKNVESVLLDDKCVTTEYIDKRLAELQEELVKAVGE